MLENKKDVVGLMNAQIGLFTPSGLGSNTRDGPSEIVSKFKELIKEGKLSPGARLPGERDLAQMLGVSRPTLRQALKALHLLGILETRPRSGTYITASTAGILKEPLHFAVLLNKGSNKELLETRILLEVHLAALAAEHATESDLQAMRERLAAMLAVMENPTEWVKNEMGFHQAIARSARNSVMYSIMEMLSQLLWESRGGSVQTLTDYNESFQVHYRIFEQIQNKNRRGAEDAMRAHFDYLLARIQSPGSAVLS